MLGWIEAVYEQGLRRPGYAADRFAERFCAERLRALGVESVRHEPVETPYWEPRGAELRVRSSGGERALECFALPFSEPGEGRWLELAAFDAEAPEAVRGRASLHETRLLRLPPDFPARGAAAPPGLEERAARTLRPGGRVLDREGSFEGATQVLPFAPEIQGVMEPAIRAGADAFVGALVGYPGDSFEYYVPYDGVARPIPGVWIRGSEGERLRRELAAGPVQARIAVDAARGSVTSYNVVGELPGADDETVVIGSHHDGPWRSAVEDASGIALVLAQAAYWARIPREERPHRLLFLLNAGHMAGAAGCHAFLDARAGELGRVVLALHLEHAAREVAEGPEGLAPTGLPEPRWWFTSEIPRLQGAVESALRAEGLDRSLLLPPDALGPQPTTDGGPFHPRGVPLVNYLTAPFYLFDAADTLDKVHPESLVPVTRAAIRLVEATRGVSAAALRAERLR